MENDYGATFFVNFARNISRTEKTYLQQEIENVCGIVIDKIHARHATFFIPKNEINNMANIHGIIETIGCNIAKHNVAINEENKKFIKELVIAFIVKRIEELETEKTNTMVFAKRINRFKNITKEYLLLRKYGNTYHNLLGINNAPIERRVTETISQVAKFYDLNAIIEK